MVQDFYTEDEIEAVDCTWGDPVLKQYSEKVTEGLLNLGSFSNGDVVVDLACGTGFTTEGILRKNPKKIIGIDFSELVLRRAREKFNGHESLEFKLGDMHRFSHLVRDVNKVVCQNAIPYAERPKKVFEEVHKALVPGGEFLFNLTHIISDNYADCQILNALCKAMREVTGIKMGSDTVYDLDPRLDYFDAILKKVGFNKKAFERRDESFSGEVLRRFVGVRIKDSMTKLPLTVEVKGEIERTTRA